jgi:XTP/dITP diphosphohydrolase
MRLLIASNNTHKHQELREIFTAIGAAASEAAGGAVEFVAPRDIGIDIDPDETADTFAGNALLKARAFAQAAHALKPSSAYDGLWIIADDSGLEVDALGGAPGIYSSRYHKRAPNGDGSAELLRELRDVPDNRRSARFQCAIVLIAPDGDEHIFYGTCEGSVAHEKRGTGGFGFDPVFIVAGGTRTMAELASQEKHRISHRGIAARKAVAFLAGQEKSG